VREQQLSRRLGITLWGRLGDEPVFQTSTVDLTGANPANDKAAYPAVDSSAQSSAAQLHKTKSTENLDQPSGDLSDPKIDNRLNAQASGSPAKPNHESAAAASDLPPVYPNSKGVPEGTQVAEAAKSHQANKDQPIQTLDTSSDSPLPPSKTAVTSEAEPLKASSEHTVEHTAAPVIDTQVPPVTGFMDPNDAFADAAFMDAEGFDDYSAAGGGSQAIHELLGKLGNSAKTHGVGADQSDRPRTADLDVEQTLEEPTKTKVSQRVEWLSFCYGGYLVVADAATISFEEQQLLGNIAQACCRANLLPISFPLNQDDQLPAYFSDQQAFNAFIKGRLAQSGTQSLICLGQLNSPWGLSLRVHQTPSLQACLDNPMLKADLWRGLNPI
jgi:hypothetical protein